MYAALVVAAALVSTESAVPVPKTVSWPSAIAVPIATLPLLLLFILIVDPYMTRPRYAAALRSYERTYPSLLVLSNDNSNPLPLDGMPVVAEAEPVNRA